MTILNRKIKPEHFLEYLRDLKVPFWRPIDKLVWHHTSGLENKWNGSATILHYYEIYKSRGWKSGPHIFIAPDGIWLFTPIAKKGRHAGPVGNKGSIGIEVVGQFYYEPPTSDTMCKYIALVTDALMAKFDLKWEDIFTHQDFEKAGYCTNRINAEWLRQNLYKHQDYVDAKAAAVEADNRPGQGGLFAGGSL